MADIDAIVVYKNRTNILPVSLGFDVSGDVITSQIRAEDGSLIASWIVEFDNDGSDGELILKLDDSITAGIEYTTGLMDLKRVSAGEPFAVFEKPIEVVFQETITA